MSNVEIDSLIGLYAEVCSRWQIINCRRSNVKYEGILAAREWKGLCD